MSLTEADLNSSHLYDLHEKGRFDMLVGGAVSPDVIEAESHEAGHDIRLEHLGAASLAGVLANPDN